MGLIALCTSHPWIVASKTLPSQGSTQTRRWLHIPCSLGTTCKMSMDCSSVSHVCSGHTQNEYGLLLNSGVLTLHGV